MARKDSEHQKKSMSMLFRGKAIFKPLNTGHIDAHVSCVREWIANIFFYTKNGTTIMIDRLWVGHSRFWIIPGTEEIPFVQTWPQVLKKRGILTLIWIAGAAIAAGIIVLLF